MRNRTGPYFVWFTESRKYKLCSSESELSPVIFQGNPGVRASISSQQDGSRGWPVSKQGMDTHEGDVVMLALHT